MRTVNLDYEKITYPDADAPLFGTQLYVKVEPNYDDPSSPTPADGTDDQISVQVGYEAAAVIYHSKWFGGVCWFFFDMKASNDLGKTEQFFIVRIVYGDYPLPDTVLRLGSWVGNRVEREFQGTTIFKTGNISTFKLNEENVYGHVKFQSSTGISIKQMLFGEPPYDALLGVVATDYDLYYYCFTDSLTPPAEDYEGWIGGYEIKPICSTLGIEPQKSKFYWVDRYGFIHTYYFEVTSITNGKGDKVEYSKTAIDANDNVSYYKTSISQPKITKAFQSEEEDLKNIKDIATLGSAMYLEINDVPVDPSLISALVVPNEKGLSRLTFSVDFNIENKNVVLW